MGKVIYLTSGGELPRDGVASKLAQRGRVDDRQKAEVQPHEEVGSRKVANQKSEMQI